MQFILTLIHLEITSDIGRSVNGISITRVVHGGALSLMRAMERTRRFSHPWRVERRLNFKKAVLMMNWD